MQEEKRAAEYVNPFIGASTNVRDAGAYHGLGKTIPGATYPFGLVQLSPNTITGGDNGSGYSDEHESIEGFAFTQMSGIGWYGDLGNFLVMPTIGPMHTNSGKLENRMPVIVRVTIKHRNMPRQDIIPFICRTTGFGRKRR